MEFSQDALKNLSVAAALMPQEQMVQLSEQQKQLYIGIPRETSFQEYRVALTPESVAILVANGHKVVIETQAGKASHFEDVQYSEVGASIAYDTKEVYKADIIVKVAPPTLEEINYMHPKSTLISALQLVMQPKDFLTKLSAKKITAIAWEIIQDKADNFPVVRAMGEIAGNTSILIAAEYLSRTHGGKGAMFGGISGVMPTEVVIIGAGTVAQQATRAALGLGASVTVFDNSVYKLKRLTNELGTNIRTCTIVPKELEKALMHCDVAIGAIRAEKGRTPCIVTEEMVQKMKPNAVIVDVSIDQGGCFETSEVTNHESPIFTKYDVIHYCVANIPSRVPRTASLALSNIFAPIMIEMGEYGGIESLLRKVYGIRSGVYMYKGTCTNMYLSETFKIPFKDLDLLLAAF